MIAGSDGYASATHRSLLKNEGGVEWLICLLLNSAVSRRITALSIECSRIWGFWTLVEFLSTIAIRSSVHAMRAASSVIACIDHAHSKSKSRRQGQLVSRLPMVVCET